MLFRMTRSHLFVTSGIRVGTPAITTRGFDESQSRDLANWMCDVIDSRGDESVFASEKEIERRVRDIVQQAGGRPGHIFNLGHGILPNTPLRSVEVAIECVHRFSTASSRE